MVSSIPQGTVLRQRYLIKQILGQGGFGRTYLAIDLERFKEPCVLKELIVPSQDRALWEKSKVLFQREASTLYQIQHPQIPRFWASFEDNHRLFLVQDFVNGKSYRHLLQARQQRGRNFSQAEVLHLLCQLLPVLSYIHDRQIVHRDISPENIMLQVQGNRATASKQSEEVKKLPVLIDFGAVKAVVGAYCHSSVPSSLSTCIGKAGYAPPEQLQTGQVYPHSDLYALAATCLVLLTGKEPYSLLDSQTLSWQWQKYAKLNDRFAAILEKMLAWQPSDRYQSAGEVLANLQPLLQGDRNLVQTTTGADRSSLLVVSPPNVTSTLLYPPTSSIPVQLNLHSSGFGLKPQRRDWSKIGIGAGIALLLGIGLTLPLLWRPWTADREVWVSGAKLPLSEASPALEQQEKALISDPAWSISKADRSSESIAWSGNTAQPKPIEFKPGKYAAIAQGNLQEYTLQPYLVKASQGQIMTVTLEGSGVVMNLLRSNQQGIDAAAYQTRSWTGQLPADDRYLIQVLGTGTYTLEVATTPISRPTETPTQRVKFARGKTGTTVTGNLSPRKLQRYLLNAKSGQIIAIKVLQGSANLSIISPTGERIGGSSASSIDWQGRLPIDGDYVVEVTSEQSGEFALSLEIF